MVMFKNLKGPNGAESGVIIVRMACYESGDKSEHCFLKPENLSVKGVYLCVTNTKEPFSGFVKGCIRTREFHEGSFKADWEILCGDQCWVDVPPKGAYVR